MNRNLVQKVGWLAAVCFVAVSSHLAERSGRYFPPASNMAVAQTPPSSMPGDEEKPRPGDDTGKTTVDLRRLTQREISRIRYLELRGMRLKTTQPDRVKVTISLETVNEFLLEMEGHPEFEGEASRREFRKLTPALKLHNIAVYKGAAFADKVNVTSDPEVFLEFRKNIMPGVLRGCATAGCHGPYGGEPVGLRLFTDPKKLAETTYANYVVLNEYNVKGAPLINRALPAESLLLTYMLPEKDVKAEMRHPGDAKLRPLYQTRTAAGYVRIQKWIESLKHPVEDYGVRLTRAPGSAEPVEDDRDNPDGRDKQGEPSTPSSSPADR